MQERLPTLKTAWLDFLQSRRVMRCSPKTIEHYQYTAGAFVAWLNRHGITLPEGITTPLVAAYQEELAARPGHHGTLTDTSQHAHARGVRTFLLFLLDQEYITRPVTMRMPRLDKRRQPVLSAGELQALIVAADSPRDLALILVLADGGPRVSEVAAMTWADVDLRAGSIDIKRGKGGKQRTINIGKRTRRALGAYRRTLGEVAPSAPVFQSRLHAALSDSGIQQALRRVAATIGLTVTPHTLRRTFATLALRAGMGELHLQRLLGHETLDMVRRYAEIVDDDLRAAHTRYGPVDNL